MQADVSRRSDNRNRIFTHSEKNLRQYFVRDNGFRPGTQPDGF
jgi:hypothetical protein